MFLKKILMFFKDDLFKIKFIYLYIPKYHTNFAYKTSRAHGRMFLRAFLYIVHKKKKRRIFVFSLSGSGKNINPTFPKAKLLKFDWP